MTLTMRPTGLGSGADKDRPDYTVYCGGWAVGRIYETRGGPDNLRWFWSMTITGPMTRSDRVATLEEAKAQLRKSWDAWKGLGEAGRGRLELRRTIRRERGDDTRISRPAAHAVPASDDGWVDASHHW